MEKGTVNEGVEQRLGRFDLEELSVKEKDEAIVLG